MIDIHTHILPGIDDGSRNIEESLAILREESRQGITEVMLTPHFYASQNSFESFLKRRQHAWEKLAPYLTPDLPALRLGAEVQYFEGIDSCDGLEQLKIQGSSLLLLEMPFTRWSERMMGAVLELNSREDMRVLMAHIERYLPMQPKGVLQELLRNRVLIQSNVSFFAGWKTRRKALSMLTNGEIHVIGSDCHNMGSRAPNWDTLPPKAMREAERANARFARRLEVIAPANAEEALENLEDIDSDGLDSLDLDGFAGSDGLDGLDDFSFLEDL